MATQKVSDTSFEADVLKSDKPVVVDFWAEWCGPCKMIAPALEEIATVLGEKVKVVKINIDENPRTPSQYGIRGIPTIMVFKAGQVAATIVKRVRRGAIIVLHEGHRVESDPEFNLRCLEATLSRLAEKGYRCVIPPPDQLRAQRAGR